MLCGLPPPPPPEVLGHGDRELRVLPFSFLGLPKARLRSNTFPPSRHPHQFTSRRPVLVPFSFLPPFNDILKKMVLCFFLFHPVFLSITQQSWSANFFIQGVCFFGPNSTVRPVSKPPVPRIEDFPPLPHPPHFTAVSPNFFEFLNFQSTGSRLFPPPPPLVQLVAGSGPYRPFFPLDFLSVYEPQKCSDSLSFRPPPYAFCPFFLCVLLGTRQFHPNLFFPPPLPDSALMCFGWGFSVLSGYFTRKEGKLSDSSQVQLRSRDPCPFLESSLCPGPPRLVRGMQVPFSPSPFPVHQIVFVPPKLRVSVPFEFNRSLPLPLFLSQLVSQNESAGHPCSPLYPLFWDDTLFFSRSFEVNW